MFEDVEGGEHVVGAVGHQALEVLTNVGHRSDDENVAFLFRQRTFLAIQLKNKTIYFKLKNLDYFFR